MKKKNDYISYDELKKRFTLKELRKSMNITQNELGLMITPNIKSTKVMRIENSSLLSEKDVLLYDLMYLALHQKYIILMKDWVFEKKLKRN